MPISNRIYAQSKNLITGMLFQLGPFGSEPFLFKLAKPTTPDSVTPWPPPLTEPHVHGVLVWGHVLPAELPDAHVTALELLPHVTDDDATLEVGVVAQAGGQRSTVACPECHQGDLGVGHHAGDGTVLALADQYVVHHGALERTLRVWAERFCFIAPRRSTLLKQFIIYFTCTVKTSCLLLFSTSVS